MMKNKATFHCCEILIINAFASLKIHQYLRVVGIFF